MEILYSKYRKACTLSGGLIDIKCTDSRSIIVMAINLNFLLDIYHTGIRYAILLCGKWW